ncbi:hypothetical protein IPG41_06055 [Candidatus Peregrinibacteria bacterium]|nr:MAG: hypothetical protein IPG41_06055 [Candidatus Peregrinibacteria bacterium]
MIKTSKIIIIATNRAVWNFFDRRSGNYIPKWRGDFPQEFASDEMIEGVYKYKRTYIPVYELYTQDSDQSKIYILDKTKIGKFIQYSPLNKGESKEFRLENFMVSVQPFEQDSDLMKEFLQKTPEWLKEEGAQDKQIEYLRERVLIHVYERYEFQLHKNFLGYSLVVER